MRSQGLPACLALKGLLVLVDDKEGRGEDVAFSSSGRVRVVLRLPFRGRRPPVFSSRRRCPAVCRGRQVLAAEPPVPADDRSGRKTIRSGRNSSRPSPLTGPTG